MKSVPELDLGKYYCVTGLKWSRSMTQFQVKVFRTRQLRTTG